MEDAEKGWNNFLFLYKEPILQPNYEMLILLKGLLGAKNYRQFGVYLLLKDKFNLGFLLQ